jgi:hypothetical protein
MIKPMIHIELHVIENPEDLDAAETAGLGNYESESCESCFEAVGTTDDGFVPFVVALDDEAEWIVCAECAEPIL